MSTASNIIQFEYIKVGTSSYSGNADTVNVAFRKINSNFTAISNSLTNILVPIASTANTGTVRIGHGINITPDGVISVGQTVNIGAPGQLTGAYGDTQGVLESDNNILYVSTSSYNPSFAFNPITSATNTTTIVTNDSYLAVAASTAAVGYQAGDWTLYDTNYRAYTVENLTYQSFTYPVITLTLNSPVDFTSSTVYYVATQDIWHRIPYINHQGKLPINVIPYQVGNITYSPTGTSTDITTIGTTYNDLVLNPVGNVIVKTPLIITQGLSIGNALSVSTSTSVGDYTINPVGNVLIERPTIITSGTNIQGVLTASASLTHYIGGIALGPMIGATGEAITTNDSQQDLYVLPYGDLYIGDSGKSVATHIYGNTDLTGVLTVTADINADGHVRSPIIQIPTSNGLYHELSNVNTQDLNVDVKGDVFVGFQYGDTIHVDGQVQAMNFKGTGSSPAYFSQGADIRNGLGIDNILNISNSSISVANNNTLVVTGGSGSTDGIKLQTNNTFGTITVTATNGSAVFGQGVVIKGSGNNAEIDVTDKVVAKAGSSSWTFDQYGRMLFPDGTQQVTAFTADPTLHGLTVTSVATINKLTVQTTATVTGPLNVNGVATLNSDLNVGGNAVITGNLSVLGSSTIINSTNTALEDPVIDIGTGPGGAALVSNDHLDKGMVIHYFDTQNNRMFLGRDGATGRLILRDNIDPGTGPVINSDYTNNGRWADASFGSLKLMGGTAATSNTTGDLQVAGGASVQGDLYVGGTLNLTGSEIVVGGVSFQNGMTVSGNVSPGQEYFTITNGAPSPLITFQVDSANGNTSINGTLNVTGAGTITGLASLQNNLNLAGDFNLAVNKFNVAAVTGNTAIAGTLIVAGQTSINNSLNVGGTFAINTNKFLVTGSSGNTSIAGTLNVGQNFSVATNKFTVNSSTGATSIASSLDVGAAMSVSGATSLNNTLNVSGATVLNSTLGVSGNVAVGLNTLTIDAATGNLATVGTLNVLNGTILQSSLSVAGTAYLNSNAQVAGDFSVNTNKFKVVSTSGNTTVAGTLGVSGNTALSGTLAVTGDTTVTGNTFLNSALAVANASTFSSTVEVMGSVLLDSNLNVTGPVNFNNTNESTQLGLGALVIAGGTSIAKNLYVGGNLGVTGNVSGVQGSFSGNVTDNNQRVLVNVVPSGSIGINVSNLTKTGSTVTWTINNLGVISVANGTDTTVSATTGTNVAINVTSTLQTVTGRGATTPTAISITNATDSSTTGTGALIVTGGVGIGKNLYVGGSFNVAGGTTISGNIAGANVTDNGQRVLVNVVPSGSSGINVSNLTKTGSTVTFTINNLGVNTIAGTTNNIVVSQSTGSVTVNLGTTGTAGTYAYPAGMTTDQFGRVLSVTANTATGTGPQVLGNAPIVNAPTITGSPVLSAYTGYVYANGSGTLTASPYIPGAIVTGTVPAAYTATMLTATLTFSATGDISSPTANFNGTQNVVLNTTLATVTQGAGSNFVKIAIDTKGRVVGNSAVTAVDIATVLGNTAVQNASNILVQTASSSTAYYIPFVPGTSSYQSEYVNTSYTFNPGTGVLTAPSLSITSTANSGNTTTNALNVAGGLGVTKDIYAGGNLNVGGGVYITGDLYVDGTQTFVNSSNIQTGDKVIYLSTSSANAALAVNAGLAVGPSSGSYASLLFNGADTWKSKANINPDGTYSLGTAGTQWSTIYGAAVYDNTNRVLTGVTAGTGTQIVSTGATSVKVNIVPATNSVIGGVKGSSSINVAADGTITTISSQTNITSVGTLTSLAVQSNIVASNATVSIAGQGSGDKLLITTSGTAGNGINVSSNNSSGSSPAPLDISGSAITLQTGGAPTLTLYGDNTSEFASQFKITNGPTFSTSGLTVPNLSNYTITAGSDNGTGGLGDSLYIHVPNAAGQISLTTNASALTVDPTTVTISSLGSGIFVDTNVVNITPSGATNPFQFSSSGLQFQNGTIQTAAAIPATVTATNAVLGYVKLGNNVTAAGDGTISISTATTTRDGVVKIGSGIYAAGDGTISVPAGAGGVISVTGGTGVTASASTGAVTISIGQAVATTSAVTFASVTSTGNVTDNGNRVITSVTPTAGTAINISSLTSSGPAASFTINNLGVTSLTAGTRVAISASTGNVTVSVPDVGVTAVNGSTGSVLVVSSLTAGTAMNVSANTGSITINNLGVTSLTGSTYLNVNQSTGSVTLTNLGVTNILPGTGITVNANTGTVTVTNAGVTAFNGATGSVFGVGSLVAGTNVAVSNATGTVTVSVPNIGVTAVNGSTGSVLVVSSIATGAGISASASTGSVTLTNTGVTGFNGQTGSVTGVSAVNGSTGSVLVVSSLAGGTGITVSASTGSVTVTNAGVTAFNGSAGSVFGVGSITGTANQVTASASTGSVTLSLPQSIATSSTPQFAGLTIAGTGAVSIGSTTAGSMDNVAIGATTASTIRVTGMTVGYASVASTPYTGTAASNIIGVVHAGAATVNLPTNSAGRVVTVKDEQGNAGTQNITVVPQSGTIDGAANFVINTNYGSITAYCNGTNWFII